MNEINNIRGAIKSLKNGKSAFSHYQKIGFLHILFWFICFDPSCL